MPRSTKNKDGHIFAANRRALHNYALIERLEAGIELYGSEVKSIRDNKASLAEAYCQFKGDELFLYQAHIAEYTLAHARNHATVRPRKLLLHRRELDRLHDAIQLQGLAIIPLKLYAKGGMIKLEIALARGKKVHDKRASIKERDQKREIDRAKREHR
ncbi:MAG: SsrA-binding protein SmpB [Myxococcales bacterium]|nr:SsrA-binding protein SmpB [Myxococcales bacterium]